MGVTSAIGGSEGKVQRTSLEIPRTSYENRRRKKTCRRKNLEIREWVKTWTKKSTENQRKAGWCIMPDNWGHTNLSALQVKESLEEENSTSHEYSQGKRYLSLRLK